MNPGCKSRSWVEDNCFPSELDNYSKYRYKLAGHPRHLQIKYQEPEEVAGDRLDDIDKPSESDSGLSRFPHNSASLTRSHRVNHTSSNPERVHRDVPPAPCATRLSPPRSGPLDHFVEACQTLNLPVLREQNLRIKLRICPAVIGRLPGGGSNGVLLCASSPRHIGVGENE